jgi:aspartate-semialdehyde dehydrogenase
MTDRWPVAVLGAGGYVGREFVRRLADHPRFELRAVTGGPTTVGRSLGEAWGDPGGLPAELLRWKLTATSPRDLSERGIRIAFSALPSGTAGPLERALVRRGIHVFSNAADHRLEPDVPLLIPEVNGPELGKRGSRTALLVNNPNCTTTGLAVALAPIWRLVAPRRLDVATYQALSGAGFSGLRAPELRENVVPFIPGEEEKVVREARHLLARFTPDPRRLPILVHCVRVPVPDGHLEMVTVEAARRPSTEELRAAWRKFDPLRGRALPSAPHPPVRLESAKDRPQPARDAMRGRGRARGMVVSVGRVRWEPPYLRFALLSHNAVRGGAGGSILNAEYAIAEGAL